MWFGDLKKAVAEVEELCAGCYLERVTPRWDGGINFYLTDFSVIVWKNGEKPYRHIPDWFKKAMKEAEELDAKDRKENA